MASDNIDSESSDEGLVFGIFSLKFSGASLAAIASVAVMLRAQICVDYKKIGFANILLFLRRLANVAISFFEASTPQGRRAQIYTRIELEPWAIIK